MSKTIQPMPIFSTPKTQDELLDTIENNFQGEEKRVAMMAMGWTWNYLAHAVNTLEKEEDAK